MDHRPLKEQMEDAFEEGRLQVVRIQPGGLVRVAVVDLPNENLSNNVAICASRSPWSWFVVLDGKDAHCVDIWNVSALTQEQPGKMSNCSTRNLGR